MYVQFCIILETYEINFYTKIDLNSLKTECVHLDKLLISASDIKFDDLLGEGNQM